MRRERRREKLVDVAAEWSTLQTIVKKGFQPLGSQTWSGDGVVIVADMESALLVRGLGELM
jgi:hypothetical protein